MAFEVEGTQAVVRRREKCGSKNVLDAFKSLVNRLEKDPFFLVPDKAAIWRKAFPDLPNHRHADLPDGWRAAWTVIREGESAKVLVVFLGTHKEYETRYGFSKH